MNIIKLKNFEQRTHTTSKMKKKSKWTVWTYIDNESTTIRRLLGNKSLRVAFKIKMQLEGMWDTKLNIKDILTAWSTETKLTRLQTITREPKEAVTLRWEMSKSISGRMKQNYDLHNTQQSGRNYELFMAPWMLFSAYIKMLSFKICFKDLMFKNVQLNIHVHMN
jgi:hypothetical protein